MASVALEAAELCAAQGVEVTVVDPRWVKPLPGELVELAADHVLVATVEDGLRTGGVGATVAQALHEADLQVPVRAFGVSDGFPEQGTRAEVLAEAGLTARSVAEALVTAVPVGSSRPGRT
ncbi:transketolase C-terminal domain-containing protein [Streptomyces kaempferi]